MFGFITVVCANLKCGWSMTTHKDKEYKVCPICKSMDISTGEKKRKGRGA